MQKAVHLFVQLSKIDEAKREVWGCATAEVVDKEGEIFDYTTSKPYFKSWSDEIAKATDGKSLGNVREMHEPNAVGKLVAIEFDDELKQIRVGAKIVDEKAWQKCVEGVYTGFSIGGSYVKAWKDGEFIRFTANPAEISVVDNPCNPGSHFTAVKADGTSEVRKFARTRKSIVFEGDGCKVEKDLGTVSNLAYILQSACYIQMDAAYEAEFEADGSKLPGELAQWVKDGAAILARMTQEELDELVATLKATRDRLGKAGAKHSAETKAHHEAISKCMGKIAKATAEAQEHCDALMGKDDGGGMEEAFRPGITKQDSAKGPEIQEGAIPMIDEKQFEKVQADSASALSKVAGLETQLASLKTETAANNTEIQKTLTNLLQLVEKLVDPASAGQKVARTAAPVTTVTKEQDNGSRTEEPAKKSVHDLMKETLQKPQPARNYLR